ncbi:MAG: hypothetical protein ND895_02950 [Pyrinomonadaceae bacterium]|nr:hypothetical protein [Pyrinomonadaceae bacterium]
MTAAKRIRHKLRADCKPHRITATHQDQINAELLAFIKGEKYHVANS